MSLGSDVVVRAKMMVRHLLGASPPEQPTGQSMIIETVSDCNVRCVWCPMQTFRKHKRGRMTLEQFEGIIARNKDFLLKNSIGVEPYFRGEPLLHPQFWDMCEVLRRNGVRNAGVNSNLSMRIDPDKFVEYGLNVIANVGGTTKDVHERVMKGSDFDRVTANLRALFEAGANIQLKMNPTRANLHQAKELPAFVESLGGHRTAILEYSTCYPLPSQASPEEIDYFFDNVVSDEVRDSLRFTFDMSEPGRGIRTKNPGCHFLTDVIFFDGQYSVCCHDQLQMIDVGNAFGSTIEEIRASEAYAQAMHAARECGFEFCGECN